MKIQTIRKLPGGSGAAGKRFEVVLSYSQGEALALSHTLDMLRGKALELDQTNSLIRQGVSLLSKLDGELFWSQLPPTKPHSRPELKRTRIRFKGGLPSGEG